MCKKPRVCVVFCLSRNKSVTPLLHYFWRTINLKRLYLTYFFSYMAMGDFYIERNERGNERLPVLTVSIHSGVSDGELDEDELGKRVKRSANLTLYKKAEKGDLVFNMMRAWQGAVGSVKTTGMVSPAYIVAKPNSELDPSFMDYYVQSKPIIDRLTAYLYGILYG